MSGERLVFLILALFALGGAFYACAANRIFHVALGVFLVLGSLAGIFLMLGAEFVAVVQILLYIGGIIVLIVFGIMLTPPREEISKSPMVNWTVMNAIAVGILTTFLAFLFWNYRKLWPAGTPSNPFNDYAASFKEIANAFFGNYLAAFEVLSVTLLVALIGALTIARKRES